MSKDNHPINGLIDASMQNLKALVNTDTVIGEAITTPDGTMIIPVSKVTFGFTSGGTDLPTSKQPDLFGGGAGGGVTVQPLGFLVIKDGHVQLLQMNDNKTTADHAISMMPDMVDKIAGLIKKEKKDRPDRTPPIDPDAPAVD